MDKLPLPSPCVPVPEILHTPMEPGFQQDNSLLSGKGILIKSQPVMSRSQHLSSCAGFPLNFMCTSQIPLWSFISHPQFQIFTLQELLGKQQNSLYLLLEWQMGILPPICICNSCVPRAQQMNCLFFLLFFGKGQGFSEGESSVLCTVCTQRYLISSHDF